MMDFCYSTLFPALTGILFFVALYIIIRAFIRLECWRFAQRKEYLEKQLVVSLGVMSDGYAFGAICDLQQYVKLCTRMGYKDYEINRMLSDLLPVPDEFGGDKANGS